MSLFIGYVQHLPASKEQATFPLVLWGFKKNIGGWGYEFFLIKNTQIHLERKQ